jgi:hypothetical protein
MISPLYTWGHRKGDIAHFNHRKGDIGLPHVLWALCGKIIMISKEQSHGTTEVYTRVQDFCGAVGQ